MTKRTDILVCGGDAFECDNCNKCDGRPVLNWEEKDFSLCFFCLKNLFVQYCSGYEKRDEKIIIKRRAIPEALRDQIFSRDKNCLACGSVEKLQIDHIVPFSVGGKTEIDNLQTLCKKCNLNKRNHEKLA